SLRPPVTLAGQWPPSRVSIRIDGKEIHRRVMPEGGEARWVSFDVGDRIGGTATLHFLCTTPGPLGDSGLPRAVAIATTDSPRGDLVDVSRTYHETYRPQFHFTAKENWLNDPNGLVHYDGEYHLFFQHNPFGTEWGNMTWGHAVSHDLLHWRQLDHAIRPDELGTIFSGSAVIDADDTSGFREGAPHPPMVCLYTSAGDPFTQSIAYSTDRGRSFSKYEHNPVLGHIVGGNRDPKVIWHAPTERWIMALYLDGHDFGLFSSPDLKDWTHLQTLALPGSSECPDLFELPVDDAPAGTRWVLWAADNRYMLGSFDGESFTPDTGEMLQTDYGANLYAAQTWSDIPPEDGRRIQIAWMRGGQYPGMPFNQQMSIPCELSLRTTPMGTRLYREPIGELSSLVEDASGLRPASLGSEPLVIAEGELLDMDLRLDVDTADRVVLVVRGQRIEYDAAAATLSTPGGAAPLVPPRGGLRLRIVLDRTSMEVFAQEGLLSISHCFVPDPADKIVTAGAEGGTATLVGGKVRQLRSAWSG
ncbi:MAG: hypothetical protein GF320_00585, partial [Armatimonadia bacterium]|nr:hypothetical protein [Armatimonadia bacterium]